MHDGIRNQLVTMGRILLLDGLCSEYDIHPGFGHHDKTACPRYNDKHRTHFILLTCTIELYCLYLVVFRRYCMWGDQGTCYMSFSALWSLPLTDTESSHCWSTLLKLVLFAWTHAQSEWERHTKNDSRHAVNVKRRHFYLSDFCPAACVQVLQS